MLTPIAKPELGRRHKVTVGREGPAFGAHYGVGPASALARAANPRVAPPPQHRRRSR